MAKREAGSQTGVKLAVWLPTTKSRESTRPRCVQVEWDTPLERFWWKLQLCFRPRPNPRFEWRIIVSQSCGNPTLVVSGLLLGSPGTKSHLGVGVAEKHREYYMGEGGGFPSVRAVVSFVNPELPVACPRTKSAPEIKLTNLLVGLMQVRVNN
jgi:hypothetical protein